MGERGGTAGQDLHKGKGVFGIVVVLLGGTVNDGHPRRTLLVVLLSLERVDVDGGSVADGLPEDGSDLVFEDDPQVSGSQGETLDLRSLDFALERRFSGQRFGLVGFLQELGSLGLSGVLDGRVVGRGLGAGHGLFGAHSGSRGITGLRDRVVVERLSNSVVFDGGSRAGILGSLTVPEHGSEEKVVPSKGCRVGGQDDHSQYKAQKTKSD